MSLYELESMMRSLAKMDEKNSDSGGLMSDEDYEASKERWRKLNLPDVKV